MSPSVYEPADDFTLTQQTARPPTTAVQRLRIPAAARLLLIVKAPI